MFEWGSYGGLFLTALGAATLLPMQSEAVLAGLLLSGAYTPWMLVAVATLGNVLGSVVNWSLGRGVERFRHKRWFPVSEHRLEHIQRAYLRFGYWSLFFSWVPIIGDPLTVVAGALREPFWRFILIVTLAKGGRYLLLAAIILPRA